jgi:Na+-translocating ferredoxin:NAD+ oxidoreductase RnfG subunit
MHRRRLALLILALAAPAPMAAAETAATFLTTDEALELTFPECEITRDTLYPTKEQKKRASKLAGKDVGTAIVYVYTARKEGEIVGRAYFDTHKVRTKRETVMIAVDPKSRVGRIEVLAFAEPEDYLPRTGWYEQFLGKRLDDKLRIRRDIRSVTGATLTANATTDAVRRTLALHEVLIETPEGSANGR